MGTLYVVLYFTDVLKRHNVTCYNFFIPYKLTKITMVGTIRKNKPELPPALVTKRGKVSFSSKFALTPTTMLVSYFPKKIKDVLLLGTLLKMSKISDCEDIET